LEIRCQLGEIVFKPLPEMREDFAIFLENLNSPWSSFHILLIFLKFFLESWICFIHSGGIWVLSAIKDGPVFCEKGVRTDVVFSSTMTPGRKLKKVIVYGHVLDKNLLRFRPNSSPAGRNSSCKIGTVTEKWKFGKKGPRRWLQFSLLVAPLQKMREVFVIQPVLRKNLSHIFKIHFLFPRNFLGRTHGETGKKWKKYEKVVFFALGGIPDPP
jgi:hypothetical protein